MTLWRFLWRAGLGILILFRLSAHGQSETTGILGAQRAVQFDAYVYVLPSASNEEIQAAIARQIKTAIGALRATKVSLNDRGARHNLNPATWKKTLLRVVPANSDTDTPAQILRVDYHYSDKAIVSRSLDTRSAVDVLLLADNYTLHAEPLKQDCSDDSSTDTDSLWYHYEPQRAQCKKRIAQQFAEISKQQYALQQTTGMSERAVSEAEAHRWFLQTTFQFGALELPDHPFSPEYDRLFGVGTPKDRVVAYAFLGIDKNDPTDPDDAFVQEGFEFYRTLLTSFPNLRIVQTEPFALVQDLNFRGTPLKNIELQKMFHWILDKTQFPPEVGNDFAAQAELRRLAVAQFAERKITWEMPLTITNSAGIQKQMVYEIHTYLGREDGSEDLKQKARWRYLEAFWNTDVFVYNGHSHFGHGPLEPQYYSTQNFPDRYQIMFVNSCISFNYYHEDFLDLKPGNSKNLETVVNGLPSYVSGSGTSAAKFLTTLLDGKQHSYPELLSSMRLDLPWGELGYEPLRVVDGELDNVFSQQKTPLYVHFNGQN